MKYRIYGCIRHNTLLPCCSGSSEVDIAQGACSPLRWMLKNAEGMFAVLLVVKFVITTM